ncbi:MAG: DUF2061 domain-containing protein [Flavobacteriaceae bacterium]|nr:DUF2061 domain-containing protein [Flavobacteriaceae bacterium]
MEYKEESHIRSLLKGISWRVVATADTILIVLFITCISGECSIESAIEIGLIEFVVKLAIYYVHERIWQKILRNKQVSKKLTLFKTISWRTIATTATLIISGAVLDDFEGAVYISLIELFTKFALYYFHERMWLKMPLGKIRRLFFNKK